MGATRADIVVLFVRQAMTFTLAGVALGVVLAPAALQLTRGLLFGVSPFDVTTLVAVAAVMAAVSAIAAAVPAARASHPHLFRAHGDHWLD